MKKERIDQIRRNLENFKNDVVINDMRTADDSILREMALCVKYAYELIDALDTPNVES
jgi:hypothetical protein